MQALGAAECRSWCSTRGVPPSEAKFQFADPGTQNLRIHVPKVGLELVGLSNVIVSTLGGRSEPVLLWLTDWGMWSQEFDELGIHLWERCLHSSGVQQPIATARGLVFEAEETMNLRAHIFVALLFQWDLGILGESRDFTAFASHHGSVTVSCRSELAASRLSEELGGWQPERAPRS